MNNYPTLRDNLTYAANAIRLGQRALDPKVANAAFATARKFLCIALAEAKLFGLGSVVARVLLALREVGKAQRALVA